MHKQSVWRFGLALAFLASGLSIYYVWRPECILDGILWQSRSAAHLPVGEIWEWFVFSLPDGLWYAALLCLQPTSNKSGRRSVTLSVIKAASVILPFIHESAQALEFVSGTFCPIDMTLYTLILIIYITICKISSHRKRRSQFNCQCLSAS